MSYSTDISKSDFLKILPILEAAKHKTKPRRVDLHEVFNAILYLLKTACQWRNLPKEYPKWRTVHEYFTIWKTVTNKDKATILDQVLKKLTDEIRIRDSRKAKTSFIIIDAQSVKNTDTAEEKGYDAGKKVSGIKRHIAVDIKGLPHAIAVTTANVTDRNGAIQMVKKKHNKKNLSKVKNSLVDGGYTGDKFANEIKKILGSKVEVAKRNELHTFVVIPKRWIVERSFAWLEKCRRLWKNCERKLSSSLAMVQLAFIGLLLKRS